MLDAVVQLLRNGLCCVKNLRLFEKTFLWDSNIPSQYYDLPDPLNQTTPLEVMISIFQLYALISLTRGGINTILQSCGKLRRLGRIIETELKPAKDKGQKENAGDLSTTCDRIMKESLWQEVNNALKDLFVGYLVFFIGCGFAWLVANSWHITSTNWIGGAQGLIHALSVQEVCLLPCLYFMVTAGQSLLLKAKRMKKMVKTMRGQKRLDPSHLGLEELELLIQWTPFWESGIGLLESFESMVEEKQYANEKKQLEEQLVRLGKKSPEEVLDMADDLNAASSVTKLEGYREFIYFLLNLAAFYGYMMGIVCFYWHEEKSHPIWVRRFLLNMTVADADWRGNMAGDSAWTIEPMVILFSPFVLDTFKPKKSEGKKVKIE